MFCECIISTVVILVESTISIKHTQQYCDPPINDISSATMVCGCFKMANKSANNIPITQHDAKVLLSIPVGSAWMELRPNFLESVQEAKDLVSVNPS